MLDVRYLVFAVYCFVGSGVFFGFSLKIGLGGNPPIFAFRLSKFLLRLKVQIWRVLFL